MTKLLNDVDANDCRWSVSGSGAQLRVCAAPIERGAYCAEHAAIVYRQDIPPKTTRLEQVRKEKS